MNAVEELADEILGGVGNPEARRDWAARVRALALSDEDRSAIKRSMINARGRTQSRGLLSATADRWRER